MVLESFVVPESWEAHPRRMMPVGFVYASVGMFLAFFVFGDYASIAGIFLTTIPLVVVMYKAFSLEECKDLKICKEYVLIKEHMHVLWFFLYLFLGLVMAYSFWFTVLPMETVEVISSSQLASINSIASMIQTTGASVSGSELFWVIMFNNMRVLSFCIFFSFIYGAGAMFILVWNASVIGVAIGNMMRHSISELGAFGHSPTIIQYFTYLPVGLTYLLHGMPEIAAYFLGSLAGGIISEAVVCHHYRTPQFWHIIADSFDLILMSVGIMVLAALLEVFVTPTIM
jgi:uncharacterized membrane protein SpoIIM required for sporulation